MTPIRQKAAVERAAAKNKAAALGLLQPLEALSLNAYTLRKVTAAAVVYCDAKSATSFADLVERASRLIICPKAVPCYRLGLAPLGPGLALHGPWRLLSS